MSHGELKNGAETKENEKNMLSILEYANYFLRNKMYLICSGRERLKTSHVIEIGHSAIIQDLVEEEMLLTNSKFNQSHSINAVLICRLVKNKGVNTFLKK